MSIDLALPIVQIKAKQSNVQTEQHGISRRQVSYASITRHKMTPRAMKIEEIGEALREDPELSQVRECLQSNNLPSYEKYHQQSNFA